MPTTLAAVLVTILAIIPGATGNYAWEALLGGDYRRKDWESAIRFVTFSVLGLAVYILVASRVSWLPAAAYVLPRTYSVEGFGTLSLPPLVIAYFGHLLCSGLVGAIAAGAHQGMSRLTHSGGHASSWDQFIRKSLPGRWVVVTLKSGDVYAGQISTAEESAPPSERDLILRVPAKLAEGGNYVGTPYHDLFLPAELVQNIGTIRNESELTVFPTPGQPLFDGASRERTNEPALKAKPHAYAP